MVVVRIVVALLVLVIAGYVGMWMFTGERRYLAIAWQVFRVAVVALAIFFGLMLLERLV